MDQETVMKRFSSGGTFAGALIAVMLLAPPQNCWAQSVGTNPLAGRISIMNLGRRAAFDRPDERALQAVALWLRSRAVEPIFCGRLPKGGIAVSKT